ncbi:SPOR domain-containing protein [Lysobacter sp. F6437]|uniref:SPOR domain-containing protein n=1 Tax=Lysobacter sp. F6437 TaxID=3459296 RepID=UPI00403D92A6
MEPALKQRLIGAAVLVAIAVIFLPMLIKGPAPESGVSDVPLDLPEPPGGEFETRELPLVTPGATPGGSVTGLGAADADPVEGGELPTVDTRTANGGMMPATTAGGGYAVSFGSYASADDAARVVNALRDSQLAGYQETTAVDGRTLYRVRVGPFDSRATAETARLRAAHVRDDVGSRVVALDAAAAEDDANATASVSTPAPAPQQEVSEPTPLPEDKPAAKPVVSKPAEAKPVVESKPAETRPVASTPEPAAAGVGFAVQLGAFSNAADANAMRDRARAAGLSAFVEQVSTDKGPLSRVQVGPVVDRPAAERLKAQVAAKLGINGFVHSHP